MPNTTEIRVALGWDGRRVRRVEVRARSGIDLGRMLAGRGSADAAALLPRLYSVCAQAQGAAACAALAAAAGDESPLPAAARAVRLECIHEHLWRLLVDWPLVAGAEAQYAAFLPARRALVAARDSDEAGARRALSVAASVAESAVFGVPAQAWAAMRDPGELRAWAAEGATLPARLLDVLGREHPALGRSDVALLPTDARTLRTALPAMLDASCPHWRGQAAETGALARLQAEPLIEALRAGGGNTAWLRLVARLLELARLLEPQAEDDGTRVQGIATAAGEGVGAVQTARGLLLHRARVGEGRVSDYRVLAPTDWNFAPDGPLACGLATLEADEAVALEAGARLAVMALDPCVACRVEIGHA